MICKEIEYKQGWKKKLKWFWDEMKLDSMALSGWNYNTATRKAQEHKREKFMEAFAFRDIANREGLFHIVANTYFDEELSDGSYDTSNNFTKLINMIDKRMVEKNMIFIELDSETWNLEERGDNPKVIKVFKNKLSSKPSGAKQ